MATTTEADARSLSRQRLLTQSLLRACCERRGMEYFQSLLHSSYPSSSASSPSAREYPPQRNEKNVFGESVLHVALQYHNSLEVLQLLMSHSAARVEDRTNLLPVALASKCSLPVLEFLFTQTQAQAQAQAQTQALTQTDERGKCVLHHVMEDKACGGGGGGGGELSEDVLEWLLQRTTGLSVNSVRDHRGVSVLHSAIQNHASLRVVQGLLRHFADVNARDYQGQSVLHSAVDHFAHLLPPGHFVPPPRPPRGVTLTLTVTISYLLQCSADVNDGTNALLPHAAQDPHLPGEVLQYLLHQGGGDFASRSTWDVRRVTTKGTRMLNVAAKMQMLQLSPSSSSLVDLCAKTVVQKLAYYLLQLPPPTTTTAEEGVGVGEEEAIYDSASRCGQDLSTFLHHQREMEAQLLQLTWENV